MARTSSPGLGKTQKEGRFAPKGVLRVARRTGLPARLAALVVCSLLVSSTAPAAPNSGKPSKPPSAPPAARGAAPAPHAPTTPATPSHGKAAKAQKAKPAPPIPKGYANSVRAWHTATPGKTAPLDEHGRPKLTLFALNTNERVELTPLTDRGGFSASDLDRAAELLRDPRTGNEHPIEPHLLDSVYRIAKNFSAQEIRVISGYRTPKPNTHSNHGRGRAMDMIVPGATDEDVAKFAREAGFSGVGVYPVSGFVHVDVRERSYFWVDTSGPGRKSRLFGVLGDVANKADTTALARGERPIPSFSLLPDVDAALSARARAYAAAHGGSSEPQGEPLHVEEDEDMESAGGGGGGSGG